MKQVTTKIRGSGCALILSATKADDSGNTMLHDLKVENGMRGNMNMGG